MAETYRMHYKNGNVEIELESTEKKYVDELLQKLLPAAGSVWNKTLGHSKGRGRKSKIAPLHETASDVGDGHEATIDVAAIVNRIHESDNQKEIEANILNRKSVIARILLAFYYAHEEGVQLITTGDVEKITDELGVKIRVGNVSKYVAKNRKYFSSSSARQQGAVTLYKLNLQGRKAFETFIAGQKPS